MGFTDFLLGKMKLNDEDDEEYMPDEIDEENDEEESVHEKRQTSARKHRQLREAVQEEDEDDEDELQERPVRSSRNSRSNIVPMRGASRGGNMEVCMIKPTSVDDGVEICDTLRSGRTVVINLEGIPIDIAQRIIDFASGSCYALNGKLQPISNFIVLATPKNVELTGDFDINDMISGNGINVTTRNN